MRDQWFGDEGDFVKFRLLRKICGITAQDGGEKLSLGVVWYRRETKRTGYLDSTGDYEHEDSELFRRLLQWNQEENKRGIRLIERSGLLPDTAWFGCPMEPSKSRTSWLKKALKRVAKSRVVFLDPDTGLAPTRPTRAHVLFCELRDFCAQEECPTVVVYQHSRRSDWEPQVKEQTKEIKDRLNLNELSGRAPFAVRHPKLTQRFFYVIPSERDRELVQRRVGELRFSESPWETLPAFNSG